MQQSFTVNGRKIGVGEKVFIIAELSANHGHSIDEAHRLVEAAAAAGADAIKLQTYTADTMTLRSDKDYFRIGGGTLWDGKVLHDLYQEAYTPWEWHEPLMKHAESLGMEFFSTPFDATAVEFLEKLGVAFYKIASFELVDLPLIRRVARTGKPIIMSTGMGTAEEIHEAVAAVKEGGGRELVLLKCTSAYPANPEDMNLRSIAALRDTFGCAAGLSDHTMGVTVPVAGVALGACVIEKHLTMSRAVPGPDSAFSLEPAEFAEMVKAVRVTEQALGAVKFGPSPGEKKSLVFRRSLFAVKDIGVGEAITAENVRSIRPAHGLHTRHLESVMGKRAKQRIEAGTPLSWELLE